LKYETIDIEQSVCYVESMPKRLSKRKNMRDMNVLAAHIVEQATGEPIPKHVLEESTKNQAAVSLVV